MNGYEYCELPPESMPRSLEMITSYNTLLNKAFKAAPLNKWKSLRECFFNNLVIFPEFRNMGFSSLIMQDIQQLAMLKGFQSLSFDTCAPRVYHIFKNKLNFEVIAQVYFDEIPN